MIPIDYLQKSVDVISSFILIFKVVGMFPYIADQYWDGNPLGLILMFLGLQNDQSVAIGLIGQDTPPTAFNRDGGLFEKADEPVEGSKRLIDVSIECSAAFSC